MPDLSATAAVGICATDGWKSVLSTKFYDTDENVFRLQLQTFFQRSQFTSLLSSTMRNYTRDTGEYRVL